MNITGLAIKFNRVTYMLLAIVVAFGITTYKSLPRDSMPPYTVRVASIVTAFPGASPDRVEQLITDKIEKVAQEIPEVDYITSESRTGLSVVSVALKDDTPKAALQPIWDRLRRKIELIQLPSGCGKPNVKDDDIGVVYGISVGLVSDGFSYSEMKDYADDLRNDLIALDDAAKVEIGGNVDERVFVYFDYAKLAELGLSGSNLKQVIAGTNIIIPSGDIDVAGERIILETSGNLESLEELQKLLVPVGNSGKTVRLGEITTVTRGYVEPRQSVVRINGNRALSLAISLKDGANIVSLGEHVDKTLVSYNKKLPVGLSVVRIASQDTNVSNEVSNFVSNLLQSIVIVLVVMLMFLGLRTGVVVASLIPAAVVATIMVMGQVNVGLNQVSLAALIMALGMLVDNAIVMSESMMVSMERGLKQVDAAIQACKELAIPLLVSSLTTSAAFLSFYMAESVMGEIMGQLFVVITISLISSWIMALTVVPLLGVVLIRIKKKKVEKKSIFDKLNVYYNRFLKVAIGNPVTVIISVIVCFILSIWGFGKVPFVFMPDSERNLVTVDINLPLGTNINTTEKEVLLLEEYIKSELLVNSTRDKGVTDWSSFIGKGPNSYDLGYSPAEANSGYAHLLINTTSGDENQMVIDALDKYCFERMPDAKTSIKRLGSGGGASIPIEVRLSGKDPNKLVKIAETVKEKLYAIEGTKNIDDDWGPKIKKFAIDINQEKLSATGLTNQDVALSASTILTGYEVGKYREDNKTIPIMLREQNGDSLTIDDIETVDIFSQNTGTHVPLAQVATINTKWQFAKILRRDLSRTMKVESRLKTGVTAQEVLRELTPWLEEQKLTWPDGYDYEFGGESESSGKAMGAVANKLPISVFIIIMLLVLQFNSFRKTSIVLSTIPLGIVGVVGGLLLTGTNFSFTAFLGIISLAGIVINNAIVLIDRIQIELNEHNKTLLDAVTSAANERFRPILLTTFTTSFGLIPLWIGGGVMWEPMAVSIIFGLMFATIITLIFVPILFSLMYRKSIA